MKIKQIIPADGWYAEFFSDEHYSYAKVLYFALIEWSEDTIQVYLKKHINLEEIEGFYNSTDGTWCSKEMSNFQRYVYSPDKNLDETLDELEMG